MDILSHGLWGATILRQRRLVWWALLAGMAPDILGSGSAFVYLLTVGKFWGTDTWQYLPQWTRELYHVHHSLLSVVLYWLILLAFLRRYDILIIPYLFHVLLDGFTHDTNILNRFLYPLAVEAGMHGLNWWEHWWIMALNAAGLAAVNLLFVVRRRRQSVAS